MENHTQKAQWILVMVVTQSTMKTVCPHDSHRVYALPLHARLSHRFGKGMYAWTKICGVLSSRSHARTIHSCQFNAISIIYQLQMVALCVHRSNAT